MLRDVWFFWLGLGILLANKCRYTLRGYRTPRPFRVTDINKVIAYDMEVVQRWEAALHAQGVDAPFAKKRVLELGPGADLGVGLLLLAKGAATYCAVDANVLITQAPRSLYSALLDRLSGQQAHTLRNELAAFFSGKGHRLQFFHDKHFTLQTLPDNSADIVVSNAAFEHFDDVGNVLTHMTRTVAPGGVLCLHVDLQTHTRVIRDRDPLNIYRYPTWLYRRLHFSGIPNRIRPSFYEEKLALLGWRNIVLTPVTTIPATDRSRACRGVARAFRSDPSLHVLSFLITARKN